MGLMMSNFFCSNNWGEFSVEELFGQVTKPRVLHTREVVEDEKGIPYVVRSKYNNGVKMRVKSLCSIPPTPGGVITFGAENSTFFFQPEAFYSGRDIYYLDTRGLDALTCLFVITCLQPITKKYSYSNGLFPASLQKETIKLPIYPNGLPNWAAMQTYMQEVSKTVNSSIELLRQAKLNARSIVSDHWRKFPIGKLFDIKKGTRLTRANMIAGNTPFIGATLENNGITAYIGNDEHIHPGGLITVAYNGQKATGKAFYQPTPFWASDDVCVLYPKFSLTESIALFLCPIFWEAGKPYAFDDKWGKAEMSRCSITLPAGESGEPDWDSIDSYMAESRDKASGRLSTLLDAISIT